MKLDCSLSLCVVSATHLLVLLCSILTSYCPPSAYGLSFAGDVHSSAAATLAQPTSRPKAKLTPRVVQRHRCNPRTERNLRKKLENRDKTIRNLKHRLALKENNIKLSELNSKVQAHHENENVYCDVYALKTKKKNSKKFNKNSSLAAMRKEVKHLGKDVKYLQRWYMKQVTEVDGLTYSRRQKAVSEVKRITELVLPSWNVSDFTSDSQSLSENLISFRDGLIIIGSVVSQMSKTEPDNKAVALKLKHLELSQFIYGIYPLLTSLYKLAANLNATLPDSHLCTESEWRDKIAALEAGSESSLCGTRTNQPGRYCRSYGFFTFVRRFLVRLGKTVSHLSGDSAALM